MSRADVEFKHQQACHDSAMVGCRSERPSTTKNLPTVEPSNETKVIISNHQCTALLDTGSSVSTIEKSYYDEHFASNHPMYTLDELIHIEGAGGHTLPYLGFILVKILVPGETCQSKNISCIILIVLDVSYHRLVPV